MSANTNVYNRGSLYTLRTNIDTDEKLIRETLKATGLKTKREVVELGLETLLRLKRQERLAKSLRGGGRSPDLNSAGHPIAPANAAARTKPTKRSEIIATFSNLPRCG